MGKYNDIARLKKVKARTTHVCSICNSTISTEYYYKEDLGKIHSPSKKLREFCVDCYSKLGDQLLNLKAQKKIRSLDEFL